MYRGFPVAWLASVACQEPNCAGELHAPEHQGFVIHGTALCRRCGKTYPVQAGILRLLNPDQLDDESSHEREVRDNQAKARDFAWESTEWVQAEILPTIAESQPLLGADVLELGAGEGRYSVLMAAQGARLLGVDFSFSALSSLASRVQSEWEIGLVEADCTTLQVQRKFDLVASTLMSNLPTASHRKTLYQVVDRALRDEGKFVFSTHHNSWRARLARMPKSGHYRPGGIYRYLFDVPELRRELRESFEYVDCRPIQIRVPLSGNVGMVLRLSRLSERIWPLNRLGELLLVTAKRPLSASAPLTGR